MSQTVTRGKTGGDTDKKKSWIQRVLRRGGSDKTEPKSSERLDPKAFNFAQDFGLLLAQSPFRDFPPPLRARLRAPVEEAIEDKDFVTAAQKIEAFKAATQRIAPDFLKWQDAAPQLGDLGRQVDELVGWNVEGATDFHARIAAIRVDAEKGEFGEAVDGYDILEGHVTELHTKTKDGHAKWLGAAKQLDTVEKQIAELAKAKSGDAATHGASLLSLKQDADTGKFADAVKALETLAALVLKAVQVVRAAQKLEYETERKAMALDEKGAMRIGDTPEDLKNLRDTFIAARTKVELSAGKGEYDKALEALPELKADLKAALDARRKAIEGVTTREVGDIQNQLDATGTGTKKVWQDVGTPAWKTAVDGIVGLKVDDEFNDSYDAKSAEVAVKLAKDPIILEAYDKWNEWSNDPTAENVEKMEKLMSQVVKLQCEVLKIDPPTPTGTFTNTARPGLCGQYSRDKNKIELNTANAGFKDFRELLDTLTHENTHAYQAKLIKGLDDGTLKAGDPEYNSAMIFKLNTNKGYVTSSESDQYPEKDAYNQQPKEVHAWRAGRVAGQAAFDEIKRAKATV